MQLASRCSRAGLPVGARTRTHRRVHTASAVRPPAPSQGEQPAQQSDMFETDLFTRALRGKSFLCTECGKCCTGSGEVWVSTDESERIAQYLNMPLHKFYQMYTKSYYQYDGWRLLKSQRNETMDCIFLKDKLCTIHPVRPRQCSTYPWWPDLMSNEDWNLEKQEICEGFDHPDAKPLDAETLPKAAEQLRISMRDNQRRLMSHKKYAKAKPGPSLMDMLESSVIEREQEEALRQEQQQLPY